MERKTKEQLAEEYAKNEWSRVNVAIKMSPVDLKLKSEYDFIAGYEASELRWMPIIDPEPGVKAPKLQIGENTLIFFDNGQIRRHGESDHPFAVATHYFNLPSPPRS